MPAPNTRLLDKNDNTMLSSTELMKLIEAKSRQNDMSKTDIIGLWFTYRAAWYALTGERLNPGNKSTVSASVIENMAGKLRACGSDRYARSKYGNRPPEFMQVEYDTFLAMNWDRVHQHGEDYNPDNDPYKDYKDHLVDYITHWRPKTTCVDYIAFVQPGVEREPGREYQNPDKPVYEYKANDLQWEKLTALITSFRQEGDTPLTQELIDNTKNEALLACAMKNKRLTETLDNNNYTEARDILKRTKASFSFGEKYDLDNAQMNAKDVLDSIKDFNRGLAAAPEFRAVIKALDGFVNAADLDEAAERSAQVYLAVEKFTKGKKSKWLFTSTEKTYLVEKALEAVAAAVPDAKNNPTVKTLLDRFNEVRGHRLQDSVELADYYLSSAADNAKKMNLKKVVIDQDGIIDEIYNEDNHALEDDELNLNIVKHSRASLKEDDEPEQEEPEKKEPEKKEPVINNDAPDDQPIIKNYDPDKDNNDLIEPQDKLNDIQESIYGPEKTISVREASKKYSLFMDALNTLTDEELSQVNQKSTIKQIAGVLGLKMTKEMSDANHRLEKGAQGKKLDENELNHNIAMFKKDPVVKALANDFHTMAKAKAKFRSIADECRDADDPAFMFENKLAGLYIKRRNHIISKAEGEPDIYDMPQKKAPVKHEDVKKAESVKHEEPKKQEPPVKQEEQKQQEDKKSAAKDEDRESSVSYVDEGENRYTVVDMS
ncbi:MAG: hypothetical protein IKN24_07870 [Lachnospiraceae bacterium]|nr:hypothetical protein [Lachnospiraceae bacterium]